MSAEQPPNGIPIASELPKEKPKEHTRKMSYAEIASKGPKQSPSEAAAPQPPSLLPTTSSPSSSLIDVDTPSVHTVPSTFASQEIKTETQAARREREEEAAERAAAAAAAARARAEADLARKKAARGREGEGWLGALFGWGGGECVGGGGGRGVVGDEGVGVV
ncbi:hypothetical protein C8A05DRAFT_31733 [Staphylotrichum tortipilum]|uniref:Uncharacterized protein n=1 Tax=Staphylotrichum tortipilum TaxID=2831512 RepID=A0AAN6RWB5_9PEZI|nr:hypothetical protein C8A05DRAFT_31733 [Staphylotrichum longicolle]